MDCNKNQNQMYGDDSKSQNIFQHISKPVEAVTRKTWTWVKAAAPTCS